MKNLQILMNQKKTFGKDLLEISVNSLAYVAKQLLGSRYIDIHIPFGWLQNYCFILFSRRYFICNFIPLRSRVSCCQFVI